MTIPEQSNTDTRSYAEAIVHLNEAIALLDRPDEGLGYSWGLQRGQVGYYRVVRARGELRGLRDAFMRYQERGEA